MTGNGPEWLEMAPEREYRSDGVEWVALAWFAAGLLLAIAMMVFVTTT